MDAHSSYIPLELRRVLSCIFATALVQTSGMACSNEWGDGTLRVVTVRSKSSPGQCKHAFEVKGGVQGCSGDVALKEAADTRAPDLPGTTFPAERAFFRRRRTADGCKQNDERHHARSLQIFYCLGQGMVNLFKITMLTQPGTVHVLRAIGYV